MMDRVREKALKKTVREEVGARIQSQDADRDMVEKTIHDVMSEISADFDSEITEEESSFISQSLVDDLLYYGPLQALIEDESITEIMANGGGIDFEEPSLPYLPPIVYVEREGVMQYCDWIEFDDTDQLLRIIRKIAEQAGRRCDESHPTGCAMLPGGIARATYVIPPVSPDGPALNLRKFKADMMGIDELIEAGALSRTMASFLGAVVASRCPLIISGSTGSGKTTLLNALSSFIPPEERVITIEDIPELRLQTPHTERMQTREANTEGKGEVSIRDLVAISLRRNPTRIIIGECLGAEAFDMLQAMQTDHRGSMTTIHANDPDNAISRLQTMVGYAGSDLSDHVIMRQIAESLQGGLIVQLDKLTDGQRKVTSIVAVDPLPAGSQIIPRTELFSFESEGAGQNGRICGRWHAQGIQPQLIKKRIIAAGIHYDPEWFFDDGGED